MLALLCLSIAACACAAARADIVEPAPENALTKNYDGYCTTQTRGYTSRITANLPEIVLPTGADDFSLDIPNECLEQSMELVGGAVTACDADAPPALRLAPLVAGAGAALVRRRGSGRQVALCYVKLYCI